MTVRSAIIEVNDNTINDHTIKQRVHMRAGNPALACTLCFGLPAKPNFVFCQQFDHFPIMRNISEQSNQFFAQSPQFPGSETFSEITNQQPPSVPISGQRNIFRNSEPTTAQSPQFPDSEIFSEITNQQPLSCPNFQNSPTAIGKFVNRRKRK